MTGRELVKIGACSDARKWFKQNFGKEADTATVLQSALKDKRVSWVLFYFRHTVPVDVHRATPLFPKVIALLPKKLQKSATELVDRALTAPGVSLYDDGFDVLHDALYKYGESDRKPSLQWASYAFRAIVNCSDSAYSALKQTYAAQSLEYSLTALRFAKNEKANLETVKKAVARELIKIVKKYEASKPVPKPRRKKVAVKFGIEPVTDSDLAALNQLETQQSA